jgi:hypothetical protein
MLAASSQGESEMKAIVGSVVLVLGLTALACAGGHSDPSAGEAGDEQDVKSTSCAPITTLTCQPGFESTTQGCAQSHVAGAVPLGHCVSVDVKKLVGTFTNPQDAEDDLSFFAIAFSADGSYDATGGCRGNPSGGPSCGAIMKQTGTWSIQTSGPQLGAPLGAPELVLVDSFNQKQTLFYTLNGSKLTLKTTLVGNGSLFVKQ